jgi:hypothetical protein
MSCSPTKHCGPDGGGQLGGRTPTAPVWLGGASHAHGAIAS